jgi:hypothetical protein
MISRECGLPERKRQVDCGQRKGLDCGRIELRLVENRRLVVTACNLGGLAAIIQRERVKESYPG